MRVTSLTLRERRGHGDLHSVQTAEVTAGVQSHNSSCVAGSRERKRARRVQMCSYRPTLGSVTIIIGGHFHPFVPFKEK